MNTDFEKLIPKQVLFSIKDIDELGIIKSDMCKKLLYRGELEVVKIGSKNYFSRTEIIRYLESQTITTVNREDSELLRKNA
ncbi:MAG: DNA-binding protein [Campylobacterota bacterium]